MATCPLQFVSLLTKEGIYSNGTIATIRVNGKDGWPCQLRFFLDHLLFILALQLINIQIRFIYQCFSWKRCWMKWWEQRSASNETKAALAPYPPHTPPHPAALLLRLCLLAVCWLNMSEGINPISRGCWGEIGRSLVWLLPPSMHVVRGGGMTPAQALTQIYSVCAWVHPGCVWQTCWGLPCCHLSISSALIIPKKINK